jgi:hypothetical protein
MSTSSERVPDPPVGRAGDPVPHYAYDASLLFHRMEFYQIDRAFLADIDPLLFRELQAVCVLCPSKEQCVADNLNGSISEASRTYCPNARSLIALSEQTQKIALPHESADPRLGPQQYYYVSSKGGVVPHWWAEMHSACSKDV